MSGEREALMVGAGESFSVKETLREGEEPVEVEYTLRPVRVRELLELEKAALKSYKTEYLTTFKENASLLGGDYAAVMREEMARVAKWNLSDLPQMDAYSVAEIPVTPAAIEWVTKQFGVEVPTSEGDSQEEQETRQVIGEMTVKSFLLSALDNGSITPEEVRELTGKYPQRGKVRYDQWWVTSSLDGMVNYVFASACQLCPEITRDHIKLYWNIYKIMEASRIVENLTTASVGNG